MASALASKLHLKNALAAGEKGIGFWLTFPGPHVVRAVSGIKGFNWACVDGEHGQIADPDYYELCNALVANGVSPIIRVPNAEEWMVKRALDAGAHGVMTPMCHTADDARKIVSWNKYPPNGTRGFGPIYAPHAFGYAAEAEYGAAADDSLVVMVQIESRLGVENVEEIAKVDGLDVLLIGPFDLSKSMGVAFGGDEHQAAIARILAAAKAAGKAAAIFCVNGDQAATRLAQGFEVVSIGTDIGSLVADMTRQVAAATGVSAQKKAGGYS
ncbi:hypothetical protein VHUM_00969 [Vanrija humicola]|uniref:HpcH/HpaI aldolase/citrate lyase domain-containing protein n=1 Tax=Vanrija humicola TaxID=5417 RepID=A0A7D8V3B9_VANHU|nr:hypothetical protein VHUM_00969 [Vanrija humicola]